MLKRFDKAEFKKKYERENWYTLFHDVDFLDLQEKNYGLKQVHFVYKEKNEDVIFLSAMEAGKDLKMPGQFLRTGLYVNPNLSDLKKSKLLGELIAELKIIYNNITFYFTTCVADVRPFAWAGFDVTLSYTSVKRLPSEGYDTNIQRLLKKDFSKFEWSVNDIVENVVEKHAQDLRKFKNSIKYINKFRTLFTSLIENKYVVDVNYKFNDDIVASILILLDKKRHTAYTQLIGTSPEYYKFGIHAKIYHETFLYLEKLGIKYVDLYGADMEGFAHFKMKFNIETKPYYKVTYNKRRAHLKRSKVNLKLAVKNFLIKMGLF